MQRSGAKLKKDNRGLVEALELGGVRTALAVPMLKDGELIGCDLTEALEQQTATSQVLQVVSSSQGDLEPVFRAMLENATRICDAKFGVLQLLEGDGFRAVALHNSPPAFADYVRRGLLRPGPNVPLSRMARTKQVVHVADITTEEAYIERDPLVVAGADLGGYRTLLAVPMLRESELIGRFVIFRQEVRPFNEKQIELVRNFAAQAVIAIANARLLSELRQSLERQIATADVLQVISKSPGDLGPVFTAMLEKAVRICDAKFGTLYLRHGGDLFPQDITRVLLNLISNGFYAAIKRSAETDGGDYQPTLSAATKDLGDRVEIRIRDNGTGIPPEVKDKMFNPFFTTKPAGEGTGLGLSISHDIIVKQHAGSIEVDTEPGKFTEFRIVLPRTA
jgi:signal transduction histidine kinase